MFMLAGVTIGFNPENYSVNEVDGEVVLNVAVLSGTLERPVTVTLSTRPGEATEDGAFGIRSLFYDRL
jgi:hypothetical protein